MSIGHTPAIFVSSTCYDLKHIRNSIKSFIEEQLGYEAILSEEKSFPQSPGIGTVDNCIEVIKERADIFVLIVGGKYGCEMDNGKSVTNLEYINARAKGIPIYTFVSNEILTILPMWEKNPDADFSSYVDTPKLLEFVNDLYGKENIWVCKFETPQDIIDTLKTQLGYLFSDSIKLRQKVYAQKLSSKLMKLDGAALRIVLEKPSGWEILLLGEALEAQFRQAENLRSDLKYGISFCQASSFTNYDQILEWMSEIFSESLSLADNLSSLFNVAIPDVLDKPGESGETERILYIGDRFGRIYEGFIRCGLKAKAISVEDELRSLINALSNTWLSPLNDLDIYRNRFSQAMNILCSTPKEDMKNLNLDLSFHLSSPDLEEYHLELARLRAKFGLE